MIHIEAGLQDDGMVCITVKDNGKGASKEQLSTIEQELFHGIANEEKLRETIGLKNIYDRLQIYYSYQAEMSLNNSEQGGFTVTIQIPKSMPREVDH